MLLHCAFRGFYFSNATQADVSETLWCLQGRMAWWGAGSSTRVAGWPLHHSASVRGAQVYLTKQSKSEQLNVPEQLVLHYPCVSPWLFPVQIAYMYFITHITAAREQLFFFFFFKWYVVKLLIAAVYGDIMEGCTQWHAGNRRQRLCL